MPLATSDTMEMLLRHDAGLRDQLRYWDCGPHTRDLDLANRDLCPTKVPALATFLASSRNLQTVDVRGNARLTSADGEALALALLENFHACPVPKFLTHGSGVGQPPYTFPARPVSAKGFKPKHPDGTAIAGNEDVDLNDDRAVRERVAAVQEAMKALRAALAEPPGAPEPSGGVSLTTSACNSPYLSTVAATRVTLAALLCGQCDWCALLTFILYN